VRKYRSSLSIRIPFSISIFFEGGDWVLGMWGALSVLLGMWGALSVLLGMWGALSVLLGMWGALSILSEGMYSLEFLMTNA